MKEQAILQRIEHDRKITWESDRQFLLEYQRLILLALRDGGILNEIQYQYAEQNLKQRRCGKC